MINKQNLHKLALVSVAIVLILVGTAGATRFGNVILKTDSSTGFVDVFKSPACGCDNYNCGCDWGCDCGCRSFMDHSRHGNDNNQENSNGAGISTESLNIGANRTRLFA